MIFIRNMMTVLLALILLMISSSIASDKTGEEINWQVISSGGTESGSTNFGLNGTAGQTAVGAASSSNFGLSHGFWQSFASPGCCQLRGDVAIPEDGAVLVNDLVWLVNYLFKGGTAPDCLDAGDCAIPLDGQILVNDLVWLVDYLFKGGQAPPPC